MADAKSPSGLADARPPPHKWGGFHAGKAREKRRPAVRGAGRACEA